MKNGWQILEFDNVFEDVTRHFIKIPTDKYQSYGAHAIVDQSQQPIAGYTDLDLPEQVCQLPLIVFGDHTRVFKFINFQFFIGADGVKVLKLRLNGIEKYFFHFLNTLQIESNGYSRHFKFLKRTKILVPPLPEQKRIAAILDQADEIRRDRELAIAKLDQLAQSIFVEMFGDPVTNPMGWDFNKIADLTETKTINGFFAKNEHYVEEGIPIVWITDFINKIYVNIEGLRKVNIKEDDISKYKLAYGDVLFCRSSLTVEGIGKCAIVPKSIAQDILFECHIIKIRLGNKIIPEYFRFLSNTSYFRSKVMKNAKTSTMTTISQDGITNIVIPVPPINLQNQFASRIKALEQLKADNNAALAKHNTLFASLQHSAFTGQL